MKTKLRLPIKLFSLAAFGAFGTHSSSIAITSCGPTLDGAPLACVEPTGTTLKTLEPATSMAGGWGDHNDQPSIIVSSPEVTVGGPDPSTNQYCHTFTIVDGTTTVDPAILTVGFFLHNWTAPCQVEQEAWNIFMAEVKEHELGHKKTADDWNSGDLPVQSPAVGRTGFIDLMYGISASGNGDSPIAAEDSADIAYELLLESYENTLKNGDMDIIQDQYHEDVGEEIDPPSNVEC